MLAAPPRAEGLIVWKWIGIGLGTITLLLIAFIVGMALAPDPVRVATRDIFIIILAVFQLVTVVLLTVVLLVLIYALNKIDKLARLNLMPKFDEAMLKINDVLENTRTIADNARTSVSTVSGSTSFVSERVVSPIIRLTSLATGVRAAATTLARRDLQNEADQQQP